MKKTNSYRARKGKAYTIVYEVPGDKLYASDIIIGDKKILKIKESKDARLSYIRFRNLKNNCVEVFSENNKRIKCRIVDSFPATALDTARFTAYAKVEQISFFTTDTEPGSMPPRRLLLTTDTDADINEAPKPAGGN